jgi:hypothetical protein
MSIAFLLKALVIAAAEAAAADKPANFKNLCFTRYTLSVNYLQKSF